MREIKLNKEYTYKQICECLGWDSTKGGNTKKFYISKIEKSFEFYHPINKKTHKEKKSYVFTKVINLSQLYTENRGGAREGAGRKLQLEEQFKIVFDAYLHHEENKSVYYHHGNTNIVYFNNDSIAKYFSIYEQMYNLDDIYDEEIYDSLCIKLRNKINTIILNKIEKLDNIKLDYGIVVNFGIRKDSYVRRDDLLDLYNKYEKMYLKENGYLHTGLVAKNKKWQEMVEFIIDKFKEELGADKVKFRDIKKYHRIEWSKDYNNLLATTDEVNDAKEIINQYVYDSILSGYKKKVQKMCDDINRQNEDDELFGGAEHMEEVKVEDELKPYQKVMDLVIKGIVY